MRPLRIEFQAFGPYTGYEKVDFEEISKKGRRENIQYSPQSSPEPLQ